MGRHWPLANDRLQTLIVSGSRSLRAELLTFGKDSSALNVPTGAKHLQSGKIPWLESLGFLRHPTPDPRRDKADQRTATQTCRLGWSRSSFKASSQAKGFCGQRNHLVLTFAQRRRMNFSSGLQPLSIFNAWRKDNALHHWPLQVFYCDQ